MAKEQVRRFDPIDIDQFRLLVGLAPHKRVLLMLEAGELVTGLIRGRLRRQHPELSARAINLKLLEELAREVPAFSGD